MGCPTLSALFAERVGGENATSLPILRNDLASATDDWFFYSLVAACKHGRAAQTNAFILPPRGPVQAAAWAGLFLVFAKRQIRAASHLLRASNKTSANASSLAALSGGGHRART